MLKIKRTNVLHSLFGSLIPNMILIIGLSVLDIVSVFNFANDLLSDCRPEVIVSFAATFIIMIDFGAVVLGHILSDRLRRQSLFRISNISLIVGIIMGVGFLIALRVMSGSLVFDGGSADMAAMFGSAAAIANSGLSPAIKAVMNVFLSLQIVGTAAISFALSVIRSDYKKMLDIEMLERRNARYKGLLQYIVNLRDSGFRALTEEKKLEHDQMYDTYRAENIGMKERILSEFTLGTNIQWLNDRIVNVTEAPHIPYLSSQTVALFNTSPSVSEKMKALPAVETPDVDYPDFNKFDKSKKVNAETAVQAVKSESSIAQEHHHDDFYEEDV